MVSCCRPMACGWNTALQWRCARSCARCRRTAQPRMLAWPQVNHPLHPRPYRPHTSIYKNNTFLSLARYVNSACITTYTQGWGATEDMFSSTALENKSEALYWIIFHFRQISFFHSACCSSANLQTRSSANNFLSSWLFGDHRISYRIWCTDPD